MSSPKSMSMGCSCSMQKDEARKTFSISSCVMCTRPMIFCVPTPLAMPAQRWSTRRMMLQRRAHVSDMMVVWAPAEWEFKKALKSHEDRVAERGRPERITLYLPERYIQSLGSQAYLWQTCLIEILQDLFRCCNLLLKILSGKLQH